MLDGKFDTEHKSLKNDEKNSIILRREFPRLIVCAGNSMHFLHVVAPWSTWALYCNYPTKILRCPKMNSAARFLVTSKNTFSKLYAAKTGNNMATITPKSSVLPVRSIYDRGIFLDYQDDRVIIYSLDDPNSDSKNKTKQNNQNSDQNNQNNDQNNDQNNQNNDQNNQNND